MNNIIFSTTDGCFVPQSRRKHTYSSINCSSPFSSGDILKSKDKNPLWTHTIANASQKKQNKTYRSGLAALYLEAMWLSFDVKVADMADMTTRRGRRSPGCRASWPVVEGWEVAEVAQLWPAAAQQPGGPAAQRPASSDFTRPSRATQLWSHHERARARQRWSRDCERTMGTNPQWTWRRGRRTATEWNGKEWKWLMCGDCKGEAVSTGRDREHRKSCFFFLSFSFTVIAFFFFWQLLLFFWPERDQLLQTKNQNKCWSRAQLSLQCDAKSFSGALRLQIKLLQSKWGNSVVYLKLSMMDNVLWRLIHLKGDQLCSFLAPYFALGLH